MSAGMTIVKMHKLSDISIQFIKGVGPARKKIFEKLGVESVEDLFYLFPRRYEDRRKISKIAQLRVGEWQTVTGVVQTQHSRKSWFTKKHLSEVVLDDKSGKLVCVWFNQPYIEKYLNAGKQVVCYGKVDVYNKRLQMVSPEYEVIEFGDDGKENLSLNRIVPIYPLTRGMTQRYLRKTVKICLDKHKEDLSDELSVPLRNKHRLANIKRSISNIHFPDDFKYQEEAIKRISFEEFYFFQISIILRRLSITQKPGFEHKISDTLAIKFIESFSFDFTRAQKKVVREIRGDMQGKHPMLRLLQGDVGSGKTVVALFGCMAAIQNGNQACIMAPTEILARQHFKKITAMLKAGPFSKIKTALLVSGLKKNEKDETYAKIQSGEIHLVIGTHALINEEIQFKHLSFAVIDEQHKFGVRQRAMLSEKGSNPDILIMTATPIPRTLCITLYGDLDVSILDELPPGRIEVKTELFKHERSKEVYQKVKAKVKEGRQAYIIYPIIEESEALDLKAAQAMFRQFKKEDFKGLKVQLVHGQMKREEATDIMNKFNDHKIDILVATTVLEVGVDVPNASVMVIEHAERFGLAQLHQLRGRIGRGEHGGECYLIAEPQTQEGQLRMKAILKTTDGFKIAQADLEIRGPGRFFGRHQHGLNELKIANPATQLDILELARKEALSLTKIDPKLAQKGNHRIIQIIRERYPTYLKDVEAG